MQSQVNYTGIDISKSFFDVAFLTLGKYEHHKLSNDQAGYCGIKRLPTTTLFRNYTLLLPHHGQTIFDEPLGFEPADFVDVPEVEFFVPLQPVVADDEAG